MKRENLKEVILLDKQISELEYKIKFTENLLNQINSEKIDFINFQFNKNQKTSEVSFLFESIGDLDLISLFSIKLNELIRRKTLLLNKLKDL